MQKLSHHTFTYEAEGRCTYINDKADYGAFLTFTKNIMKVGTIYLNIFLVKFRYKLNFVTNYVHALRLKYYTICYFQVLVTKVIEHL